MNIIEGYVSDSLEPRVEIGLTQADVVTMIPVTIDTGFSGARCLAEQSIDQVDLTFAFAEPYELANGEIIVKDVFRATVVFGNHEHEVKLILTASNETLIGASLLKSCRVDITYPERSVRIEQGLGVYAK